MSQPNTFDVVVLGGGAAGLMCAMRAGQRGRKVLLLDRAGRITFLDVASDATECPIDRGALLARFHAQENGVLLSGAAAFAAMCKCCIG